MDKFNENVIGLDLNEESISVTELNRLAKTLLENNMPVLWIKGEVSGIRNYSHVYFDLKDEGAKISCVIFSRVLGLVDFKLENGQQIEVRGKVTVYPQNGSYQINVERIRKVGLGELWEAYHRLVNKLRLEGLFNEEFKKPIPVFPQSIGVITSKEGAVIRDVVTTLKRRMPNIPILVYHSAVQGTDAGMQIAKAIRTANRRNEVAVLIVCRGGGSMEDLWAFNEEVVAREVFNSQIPIISAVGHETDTTIIDFVADLRAPTPTAASELVAKSRNEWLDLVNRLYYQLNNHFDCRLNSAKQLLDLNYAHLKALNPLTRLREKQVTINTNKIRLQLAMRKLIDNHQLNLKYYQSKISLKHINLASSKALIRELSHRLNLSFSQLLKSKTLELNNLTKNLKLVNPKNILSRGYAIVKNKQSHIVYSNQDVKHNERLEIILSDDSISAIVDKHYNSSQGELI